VGGVLTVLETLALDHTAEVERLGSSSLFSVLHSALLSMSALLTHADGTHHIYSAHISPPPPPHPPKPARAHMRHKRSYISQPWALTSALIRYINCGTPPEHLLLYRCTRTQTRAGSTYTHVRRALLHECGQRGAHIIARTHICIVAHTHVCIYSYICISAQAHIYAHIQTHVFARAHAHACKHAYKHMNKHKHKHKHMHMHKHKQK